MYKWIFVLCVATLGFCEEETPETADAADIVKISEAMGHLIGKNLQSLGLNVDLKAVVKGMQDASEGKAPPLNEDECVQAIATLQEESLTAASEKNLTEAETFLEKNGKETNVVSLEEGKVQYIIEKQGEGEPVQSYNSPIVEYKASYLNGQIFGTSRGDELLALDEAIPGFSKGIVGMKEGEVRKIYIHPDLGYGKQGQNALLIFEVTLKRADASSGESSPKLLSQDKGLEEETSNPQ